MSEYYCLVASLPELSLSDGKLSYTVADFKTEIYPALSSRDRKLLDLFYLRFDNANVLRLLKDREAEIDPRGVYSAEHLNECLAALKAGDELADNVLPTYLSEFVRDYYRDAADAGSPLLEDRLSALYYAYALKCGNEFVSAWFAYNLHVNNLWVALMARKYKWDVARMVVGDTDICEALRTSNARDFGLSGVLDGIEQVMKLTESDDMMERERKMDLLRWDWMEQQTFFHYFSVERLFVFLLQIEMIERWISLDKEKGNQLFRSLIATLKSEVQIPAEFR